jgi:hypothetical protein
MLGGIITRWKQTVAYYFTGNSTNGCVIKDIVTEIMQYAYNIGLKLNVVSITSDMGGGNRAMWKEFGIECKKNSLPVYQITHPCDDEKTVCFLADVPHVIKNIRNHIANKQLITIPPNLVY